MQPGDSLIYFFAADHALLSQYFGQHLQDIRQAYPAAFDEAGDHPHMLHHGRLPRDLTLLRFGHGPSRFAFAVLDAFLALAVLPTVIIDTASRGLSLAVGFLAAERTTQVFAAGIARMSEEKDAAMPAPAQARSQVRPGFENRSQEDIVLQDQSGNLIPAIPLRTKLEILRDLDCKKPKLSLRIVICCRTSSSYPSGTPVSR